MDVYPVSAAETPIRAQPVALRPCWRCTDSLQISESTVVLRVETCLPISGPLPLSEIHRFASLEVVGTVGAVTALIDSNPDAALASQQAISAEIAIKSVRRRDWAQHVTSISVLVRVTPNSQWHSLRIDRRAVASLILAAPSAAAGGIPSIFDQWDEAAAGPPTDCHTDEIAYE